MLSFFLVFLSDPLYPRSEKFNLLHACGPRNPNKILNSASQTFNKTINNQTLVQALTKEDRGAAEIKLQRNSDSSNSIAAVAALVA